MNFKNTATFSSYKINLPLQNTALRLEDDWNYLNAERIFNYMLIWEEECKTVSLDSFSDCFSSLCVEHSPLMVDLRNTSKMETCLVKRPHFICGCLRKTEIKCSWVKSWSILWAVWTVTRPSQLGQTCGRHTLGCSMERDSSSWPQVRCSMSQEGLGPCPVIPAWNGTGLVCLSAEGVWELSALG